MTSALRWLLDHIRATNDRARRERPRWEWDPPRSRTEVKRRYRWDWDVPIWPWAPTGRGRVHSEGEQGEAARLIPPRGVSARRWNDRDREAVREVHAAAFSDWLMPRLTPEDAAIWHDRMTLPVKDIVVRDGVDRKTVQRREARVTDLAREQWPEWPESRDMPFPFERRPYRKSASPYAEPPGPHPSDERTRAA